MLLVYISLAFSYCLCIFFCVISLSDVCMCHAQSSNTSKQLSKLMKHFFSSKYLCNMMNPEHKIEGLAQPLFYSSNSCFSHVSSYKNLRSSKQKTVPLAGLLLELWNCAALHDNYECWTVRRSEPERRRRRMFWNKLQDAILWKLAESVKSFF